MDLIEHTIPANAEIIITSDWHEGSAMQYEHGITAVLNYVMEKPNRYMIHGGDLAEAITVDDKRFQMDALKFAAPDPLKQYQSLANKLRPLAKEKRILGIHQGNHDARLDSTGNFIRDYICKELGVSYATYSAKYTLGGLRKRVAYKIFVTHGNGALRSAAKDSIQRDANIAAALKQRLAPLAGDCKVMAMGHTHKLICVEPKHELYLLDDGSKIKQEYVIDPGNTKFIHPDHRWYLNTGSMMKLYGPMGVSGYAEKAMYGPTELGYCVIKTDGHRITNCERVVI